MYLKKAYILNSGAIEKLELKFQFNENGTPKPMLIVGKNGSGKTNLLAYITDALIEIAARHFRDVAPFTQDGSRKWYRVLGGATQRIGSAYEFALLKFIEEDQADASGKEITYICLSGKVSKNEIEEHFPSILNILPPNFSWPSERNYKEAIDADSNLSEKIYRSGCYACFPSDRTEKPYWTIDENQQDRARFSANINQQLHKPIVVQSSFDNLKPWLVDKILDQSVDIDRFFKPVNDIQGEYSYNQYAFENYLNYIKKHKLAKLPALHNINRIICTLLQKDNIQIRRSQNQFSKITLFEQEKMLLPSLDSFSAGQGILVSIFGTILHYSDNFPALQPTQQMTGIVVIDEIDAHLHGDLQYKVLPELIKLFPKIQFIITSHSPLFPLGMSNLFGDEGFAMIDMPDGRCITAEQFTEFKAAFDYMEQTKAFNQRIKEEVSREHQPLILCEGKTDPDYIKKAAELLGFRKLFENVTFDWIGYTDENGQAKDGGYSELEKAIKLLRKNPSFLQRKVIFLFDCDQKKADADFGDLYIRGIKPNIKNQTYEIGIENLLPETVFEERFIKKHKKGKGLKSTVTTDIKKAELCDHICSEGKKENFENFRPLLEELCETLDISPPANEPP